MAPARSNTANVSWCMSTRASSSCPSVTRVSAMRGCSGGPPGPGHEPGGADDPLIDPDVVARHPAGRVPALELLAAPAAIEPEHGRQRLDRLLHRVDDRAAHPRPED